jgi:hypothetical protein
VNFSQNKNKKDIRQKIEKQNYIFPVFSFLGFFFVREKGTGNSIF